MRVGHLPCDRRDGGNRLDQRNDSKRFGGVQTRALPGSSGASLPVGTQFRRLQRLTPVLKARFDLALERGGDIDVFRAERAGE